MQTSRQMGADRRGTYAIAGSPTEDRPDRQQVLQHVVRAELTLVCRVALKLGAALLVLEGLFWITAMCDPAPSCTVSAVSTGVPQGARVATLGQAGAVSATALQQSRVAYQAR